jgi:Carboxypeptidase regulatory-like domain/Tetratricopeptide repeat
MLYRVLLAPLAVSAVFLVASASAQVSDSTLMSLSPDSTSESINSPQLLANGSISGIVVSEDNHPVRNATVEIRKISGPAVATGVTGISGSFSLRNVPSGTYEVSATSGVYEAQQVVNTNRGLNEVTLRLPHMSQGPGGPGVVSVQQLQVPDKAKDALRKAQAAAAKDEMDKAQKELNKALKIAPDYSQAVAYRGVLAMAREDYAAAGNDFNHAIQLDNSDSMAYIGMGAVYNAQGKYDDAIRELNRGLALSPRQWNAHLELSKAELGKGNLENALKEANQAEALSGKRFSPLHLLKGQILVALKLYSGAVNEFQQFLKQNKDNPAATAKVQSMIAQTKALADSQN